MQIDGSQKPARGTTRLTTHTFRAYPIFTELRPGGSKWHWEVSDILFYPEWKGAPFLKFSVAASAPMYRNFDIPLPMPYTNGRVHI